MQKKHVLVIGGGVSGISTALRIVRAGHKVTVVEKQDRIGGQASLYCCKATDICQKCGVCLVPHLIEEFHNQSKITLLTGQTVHRITRKTSDFSVSIGSCDDGEKREILVDSIAVAIGFAPFRAERKTGLGYGVLQDVLTAKEVEERIRIDGTLTRPSDGKIPLKIGFIQCVGSRDNNIGNDWCSRICCTYAMRLAILLRHRLEDSEITMFYMDIQSSGKGFRELFDRFMSDKKIHLNRTIPGKIIKGESGKLIVQYENLTTEQDVREEFDLVILSIGLTPALEFQELSEKWDIPCNEWGFLKRGNGIYPVGTCRLPMTITESISDAEAVSARILMDLRD